MLKIGYQFFTTASDNKFINIQTHNQLFIFSLTMTTSYIHTVIGCTFLKSNFTHETTNSPFPGFKTIKCLFQPIQHVFMLFNFKSLWLHHIYFLISLPFKKADFKVDALANEAMLQVKLQALLFQFLQHVHSIPYSQF